MKLRITYKKEGDRFQCDALCDSGYAYTSFFRHENPPKKYIDQGLSPLHARLMFLFDSMEDKYHECGVDNLYMSAKFARDAYMHENKIKLHGVTRKSGRGLPSFVLQEEVQNRTEQEKVRGTVCAAELRGDPHCPSLLAVSVYDTKPVHFLTMCANRIYWQENERHVYDCQAGKMKKIKFHCLNDNNDYNFGMGGADIADQIRGSYRVDHWLRNFKWWHSVFWWGDQVLMVNLYQCYCKYYKMNGLCPMPHYEFQRRIAHVWLDKDYYSEKDKNNLSSSKSVSSGSTRNSSSSRRSRVSGDSLHPLNGNLKCRMSTSLCHWPCPAKG